MIIFFILLVGSAVWVMKGRATVALPFFECPYLVDRVLKPK
jgi:hypothetical protein